MQKQTLIWEAVLKLNQMGISPSTGNGADITLNCEFLDAGWSTGKKQIIYEASAYFDEADMTVFLWEFSKETSSGLSFGSDGGTSFQMGKTLFRKVRSVQYGPEGKVYEYTLDLGAIPKAFKEIAHKYGWKFKTVLKREKASYPPGYVLHGNEAQPQQVFNEAPPVQQYSQEAPPAFNQQQASAQPQQKFDGPTSVFYSQAKPAAPGNKTGALFITAFIFFAAAIALLYGLSGTSIVGWILTAGVFIVVFLLGKKFAGRGCIAGTVMWIIALAVLLFIFAFTTDTSDMTSSVINEDTRWLYK